MDGLDFTSLYTTIGGVLGTPAALAFFWLWNKVKELEKRLNEGNSRFDRMDAELKEINKSLGIIIGKACLALYFEHPLSRLLGDKFLRAGLRWAGMGSFKASCVYNSVCLFGASAYDEDDALTAANSRLFTFEWVA